MISDRTLEHGGAMSCHRELFCPIVVLLILASLFFPQSNLAQASGSQVVINPLMPIGPDPWVEYKDGYYYFMRTTVTNLT